MIDIKREDAIKFLKAHSECEKSRARGYYGECYNKLCYTCELRYSQGNVGEHIKATDKAILDMEKLEKIEEVIDNRGVYALDILNAIQRIEQIVKERDNNE